MRRERPPRTNPDYTRDEWFLWLRGAQTSHLAVIETIHYLSCSPDLCEPTSQIACKYEIKKFQNIEEKIKTENSCRHCHNEVETLAHVLESCSHGEALRNARHHQVRSIIATALKHTDYNTFEEVHGLSVTGNIQRIAIIAFKESTRSGFIIDLTVRFETNEEQPAEVDKEKKNIYNPTIPYYLQKHFGSYSDTSVRLNQYYEVGLTCSAGNRTRTSTSISTQQAVYSLKKNRPSAQRRAVLFGTANEHSRLRNLARLACPRALRRIDCPLPRTPPSSRALFPELPTLVEKIRRNIHFRRRKGTGHLKRKFSVDTTVSQRSALSFCLQSRSHMYVRPATKPSNKLSEILLSAAAGSPCLPRQEAALCRLQLVT
ncbi:hypothetical protein ANN_08400 [Periplaneta americana]|uniref:Uncharacterized protein n=1 Tax=Periplaneta americana TaxID=6978 RepID=A0ABQ8T1B8_PERAM|nr:hypothetical protein ANN_08400 [Periplaneta americana]